MCRTPLSAIKEKQEDWFIAVLYVSSPYDFPCSNGETGGFERAE